MPRGDQTGPAGMGPMTGRAAGYCAGFAAPGYLNPAAGIGWGFGMGRGRGLRGGGFGGRGYRHMYWATGVPGYARNAGIPVAPVYPAAYPAHDPELEKQALMHHAEALQNQAERLQVELEAVRKRIQDLTKGSPED